MTRAESRLMKLEAECAAFNARVAVGDKVIVAKDDGTEVETVIKYPASVLSGHMAVAWLRDIRGCYLLSRVRPV